MKRKNLIQKAKQNSKALEPEFNMQKIFETLTDEQLNAFMESKDQRQYLISIGFIF